MKQLLESIRSIDTAQAAGGRHFEAHIFFDGAVKDHHPTEFVLQLVSLVESVLGMYINTVFCSLTQCLIFKIQELRQFPTFAIVGHPHPFTSLHNLTDFYITERHLSRF